MKKLLLVLLVVVFSMTQLKAQAFKNGDLVGNLGVGFGWYGYGYGATSLPAFSLSLEKGGIVGFKHASYAWNTAYSDYGWNDIIIAARGAIHYDLFKVSKLDTYGGVALGVRLESYSYYTYTLLGNYEKAHTNYTHGLFALYVGGRYFFSDKFAAFGELGYGLGYLTLGLSFKL
jgi:hypothetical protein